MTKDLSPRYQLIRDLEQHQTARLAAARAASPALCPSSAEPHDREDAPANLDGIRKPWPVSSGDERQGGTSAG